MQMSIKNWGVLFLFVLPIVYGYQVSTDTIYTFDYCSELNISVQGTELIYDNEYWFNDCVENDTNIWYCNCSDNFSLELGHWINTINTYNITMEYSYSRQMTNNGGGGGSSRRSSSDNSAPVFYDKPFEPIDFRDRYSTNRITKEVIVDEAIKENNDVKQNMNESEINEFLEEHEGLNWWLISGIIFGIIIIAGLIFWWVIANQ